MSEGDSCWVNFGEHKNHKAHTLTLEEAQNFEVRNSFRRPCKINMHTASVFISNPLKRSVDVDVNVWRGPSSPSDVWKTLKTHSFGNNGPSPVLCSAVLHTMSLRFQDDTSTSFSSHLDDLGDL